MAQDQPAYFQSSMNINTLLEDLEIDNGAIARRINIRRDADGKKVTTGEHSDWTQAQIESCSIISRWTTCVGR